MAKDKATAFFCTSCGYESPKWVGQCPGCKSWNTMAEELKQKKTPARAAALSGGRRMQPLLLEEISLQTDTRFPTGFAELDRVLGGGLVPGSLLLTGGDPGIGKSTLLLQVCRHLAADGKRVLYISGEESLQQIKLRAMRIGSFSGDIRFLCETNLDDISATLQKQLPQVVVIDSIQTMYREEVSGAPGSVGQVRESTNTLLQLAKGLGITIFIVGHVTKEGTVAGPRVLEHMVDTVLYFEGDRYASYRILRSVKNRFGATNEIGVFEMCQGGLSEVKNPSEFMLSGRPCDASGSVIACVIEGTRPLLLEIQALISRTSFGMPRRTSAGADYNRVNLLMAVLEKRAGLSLSDCDAYINIAGGLKIAEPSLDLALIVAIVSSYRNVPIDDKMIIFGEVGLSGEVRGVQMAEQRIQEAAKLGFTSCMLPRASLTDSMKSCGIKLIGISNVEEALYECIS